MKPNTLSILILIIGLWSAVSKAEDSAESFLNQAKELLVTDLDLAEEYIEKALKLEPNNPEVAFICGRIMGLQAEDSTIFALSYAGKALDCLKTAVKNAPEIIDYHKGLLNFYLGAPSIAGGDVELALEQVQEIAKLDSLQGVKAEVKYLRETENDSQLLVRFKQFSIEFPNDLELSFQHGLLLQKLQEYEQAYNVFSSIVASKSDSSYYQNGLYQLGRNAVFSRLFTQQGIKALEEFVKQKDHSSEVPPLEWAYFRLAQLHRFIQNSEMSDQYIELARSSDDDELHRAIKRFEH